MLCSLTRLTLFTRYVMFTRLTYERLNIVIQYILFPKITNLCRWIVFHPTDKKLYLISFIKLRTQFSCHAHQGKPIKSWFCFIPLGITDRLSHICHGILKLAKRVSQWYHEIWLDNWKSTAVTFGTFSLIPSNI